MRWLAFWCRQVFCPHSWKTEETPYEVRDGHGDVVKVGFKVSATCGTCGWHRSYWKW